MKRLSHSVIAFFIFIASVHASNETNWDSVSDQQIKNCLSSDTFQNIWLIYPYEGQNWELRIIFNPQHAQIGLRNGQPAGAQFYYGVFSGDVIPESLENHLQDIAKNELKLLSGGYWSIGGTLNDQALIDYLADAIAMPKVEAVQSDVQNELSNEENIQFDHEICDLFNAQDFKKLSLEYPWQGKTYSLHFVYNPKREALLCKEFTKPVRWPFAMTVESHSYPFTLYRK